MDEIDKVFTLSGLEKDPLTRPQDFKNHLAKDPRDVLTEQESE